MIAPRWGAGLPRPYQRDWLRGDLVAGVTVAAYLIPQVMAYAVVAGLPPITGLWASIVSLACYALLGSSRRLSVGPESSTALLSAIIVGPLAGDDPRRYVTLSATLAIVMGVYCLIAWLIRLGFVADLLSRPVLVGYLTGLAAVMISGQLSRITGARVSGDSFPSELRSFAGHLDEVRLPPLAVALLTLAFLLVVQRLWPRAPGPLSAVLLATLIVALFDLQDHGVPVVGHLAGTLPPRPTLPTVDDVRILLLPAVGLLVVGYTDNMLTGRAFALHDDQDLDANQELLALGAANIGSGFAHGFAVSSSASRTALGDAAGSRTQLHSLACLVTVAAVVGFGGSVLAHFPTAALGGLVLYAAIRLVDLAELKRLARFRRSELLLAVAAAVAVLTLNLLYGVLVAVGLSVAEMLHRVSRPHDAVLGQVPGLAGMHDIEDYPQAKEIPGLVIYRYDSPLFFANAEDFRRRALAAVDEHDEEVRWFVLNVEANVEVDITALDALESLRARLEGRGIVVALARVKQDLLDDLEAAGLVDSIGRDRLYPTLPTVIEAYEEWQSSQPTRFDQ